MTELTFKPSKAFSVGMEMEFQLLDSCTLNLTNRVEEVLPLFPSSDQVQPEFIQNTVELISRPCFGVAEMERDIRSIARKVGAEVQNLGMVLAGGGTHPFSPELGVMTDRPRYRDMHDKYGYAAHNQITFANHVHLGVPSPEEAMLLMAELKTLLPVLIALSANSPFWRGFDTRFAAYRHRILAASRTYGQPPEMSDWEDFRFFVEQSIAAGTFQSVNDIHWDIRPRPHLGTIEVRVMDNPATVSEALEFAAFLRALVGYLRRTRGQTLLRTLQGVDWWVHKDNCFLASRDGVDARIIIDRSGQYVWLADVIAELLEACEPEAEHLQEAAYVRSLRRRFEASGLGYQRQRAIRDGADSGEELVSALRDALLADLQISQATELEEAQ